MKFVMIESGVISAPEDIHGSIYALPTYRDGYGRNCVDCVHWRRKQQGERRSYGQVRGHYSHRGEYTSRGVIALL